MGRPLREMSPTGIYHVMLRGVNKQRIFEDLEDYNAFIRIVRKSLTTDKWGNKLDTPNFDLYAYCLMDNHVHLLIGTRIISISDVVKRIASTYARVFNERYERVGHFFQDRFRSEIVCDEEYFFHLMSYIHLNPVNGDLCRLPDEYAFSSFNELTGYYTKVSDTILHNEPDFILGGRKESIEKAIEIASSSFDREEWNARHAAWLATKFDCTAWLTWFIENYPQSEKMWRENREAMEKKFK